MFEVLFHRLLANSQHVRDLLIGSSPQKILDDHDLPGSEIELLHRFLKSWSGTRADIVQRQQDLCLLTDQGRQPASAHKNLPFSSFDHAPNRKLLPVFGMVA